MEAASVFSLAVEPRPPSIRHSGPSFAPSLPAQPDLQLKSANGLRSVRHWLRSDQLISFCRVGSVLEFESISLNVKLGANKGKLNQTRFVIIV